MNLEKIKREFKKNIIKDEPHPAGMGGFQIVFKFDNGYGASLIQTSFSYGSDRGLYEMAVLKFHGDDDDAWDLDYTTPITDDVLGHLNVEKCIRTLNRIKKLRRR